MPRNLAPKENERQQHHQNKKNTAMPSLHSGHPTTFHDTHASLVPATTWFLTFCFAVGLFDPETEELQQHTNSLVADKSGWTNSRRVVGCGNNPKRARKRATDTYIRTHARTRTRTRTHVPAECEHICLSLFGLSFVVADEKKRRHRGEAGGGEEKRTPRRPQQQQ